ncbi:MAG: Gfo/Idh/MocA family oxidoreductase [Thermoguttaceae bacterium]|jgi:predicted dehydrogenase|nr:Gfo/Idh/MocA family oxidoreductase [Thermoguttaceae bacterium]
MIGTGSVSRRQFLRHSLAGLAGVVAVPQFIPRGALAASGQPGANDRIGVAYIGCGRRGRQLLRLPAEGRIVAFADVHLGRAEELAEKYQARACQDYRKLLEDKDVDAVVVATPDHWHVLPSVHACQAGKDIYCEKPLSLTVREGRRLVDAVRQHGRVLQTGSQRRSMAGHRLGCELVRNGLAGKIHTVLIQNYPSPWECAFPGQPVPEGLDWDAWCGPTEPVPFHNDIFISRAQPGWISFRPYSGGEMTGTGTHGFDQIQWALDLDDTGPVEVWCEGGPMPAITYHEPESGGRGNRECSRDRRVRFRYANGIEVRLEEGEPAAGAVFIGEAAKIRIGNNTVDSNPPELAQNPPADLKQHVAVSDNHMQNWFDAIKSRERPIADVEIGHRSAVICHLGNIARWVGRRLRWDPEKEIFPDDPEANAYLDRPMRKPYQLP